MKIKTILPRFLLFYALSSFLLFTTTLSASSGLSLLKNALNNYNNAEYVRYSYSSPVAPSTAVVSTEHRVSGEGVQQQLDFFDVPSPIKGPNFSVLRRDGELYYVLYPQRVIINRKFEYELQLFAPNSPLSIDVFHLNITSSSNSNRKGSVNYTVELTEAVRTELSKQKAHLEQLLFGKITPGERPVKVEQVPAHINYVVDKNSENLVRATAYDASESILMDRDLGGLSLLDMPNADVAALPKEFKKRTVYSENEFENVCYEVMVNYHKQKIKPTE